MKRILLTLAIVLCSVQMVFAYTISGSRCTAEVSAAGQITYLEVDGMIAPLSGIIEAAIGYEGNGGQWISSLPLLPVPPVDVTATSVTAIYKKDGVKIAGDSLIVRVYSKIVGANPYIDQRYEVTYWENGAGPLNDVKAYLYVQAHVNVHKEMIAPIDVNSAWGASGWPNPVDTALDVSGNMRVQGYVPGILDDYQVGSPAGIRTAIEAGILVPASSVAGNAIGMSWNLGTIGLAPAAPHNALDVRATVIPEPCTMALIGTGLFGLLGMRRRKA